MPNPPTNHLPPRVQGATCFRRFQLYTMSDGEGVVCDFQGNDGGRRLAAAARRVAVAVRGRETEGRPPAPARRRRRHRRRRPRVPGRARGTDGGAAVVAAAALQVAAGRPDGRGGGGGRADAGAPDGRPVGVRCGRRVLRGQRAARVMDGGGTVSPVAGRRSHGHRPRRVPRVRRGHRSSRRRRVPSARVDGPAVPGARRLRPADGRRAPTPERRQDVRSSKGGRRARPGASSFSRVRRRRAVPLGRPAVRVRQMKRTLNTPRNTPHVKNNKRCHRDVFQKKKNYDILLHG